MKKQNLLRAEKLWCLPNHRWTSIETAKLYRAENVLRKTKFNALVRDRACSGEIGLNYSKKFCGENRPNETWGSMDLYIWGSAVVGILGQKAKAGNAEAAQELWRLAVETTGLLTQICKANPKLVYPVARINRRWPVFRRKDAKLTGDEKKLFDAIQLGRDDFVQLETGKAKWNLDSDAGKFAYSLLWYVRDARNNGDCEIYGEIGERARKNLLHDFDDLAEDSEVNKWWEFAKIILLSVYPKPHEVEELKKLTPSVESKKEKSPGRMREDILRKLENCFKAFAP